MKYNGIIFDFNGTLFQDTELHKEAWRIYSKKLRGTAFSDDEMLHFMIGRTNEEIIRYAIGKQPEPELVAKIATEKEALYRDMCMNDKEHVKLTKGATELLDSLKEHNVPITIATGSNKENLDFFFEIFDLAKWFDINKCTYDDLIIKGKPAPDLYLNAAKNLELKPAECIVFEDALSGIKSAHSAEIGKIIVICQNGQDDYMKSLEGVNSVIHDFSEFDRNCLCKGLN